MWITIGFCLMALMIGLIIGGKEGVDSCTEYINDNVMFRNTIKMIIHIKNNKELKENERKKSIYEILDKLNQYINGEIKL